MVATKELLSAEECGCSCCGCVECCAECASRTACCDCSECADCSECEPMGECPECPADAAAHVDQPLSASSSSWIPVRPFAASASVPNPLLLHALLALSLASAVGADPTNSSDPLSASDPSTNLNATASDACSAEPPQNYNVPFHVGGIFIVLAVSGIGIMATMHLAAATVTNAKRASLIGQALQIFKMFGIGIITGTAWIHLLPDAFNQFGSPCLDPNFQSYGTNYVGLFGIIGAFATQLIELTAVGYKEKRGRLASNLTTDSHSDCEDLSAAMLEHKESTPSSLNGETSGNDNHTHVPLAPGESSGFVVSDASELSHTIDFLSAVPSGHSGKPSSIPDHDHSRVHTNGSHAHSAAGTGSSLELSTIILECGILFHSLIIGITLGVSDDASFTTLLIAIAFHQMFEGMALGVLIGRLNLSLPTRRLLCSLYPLTTPLGIAIGVAVHSSFNDASGAIVLTRGVFNSLSAGILFFNAYTELMSEEVSHSAQFRALRGGFKMACLGAMYCGAAVMAVIAIWA
ncbi:ZIP zinc transporter-domain-containing protein [Chytriomyces sp. MP71]|nr:ZIP zinc transporter-domain-containing protein [Chytriomyces sp. MP71]